ncbi:MAG: PQQ-dependent dehydrogenase, methanol/ethanol family [Acidobacteriota bacterium]|nr:PQQ-dependent dehydrogenase, methanol/ethanol family [Acidobacteriota bacterium]
MGRRRISSIAALLALVAACGCGKRGTQTSKETGENVKPADVDAARIVNADRDPGDWLTYGRTYSEQRFSPLKQINDGNVGQLKLAWYSDLDTHRGQEATPIVVDGVMYFSTAWSKVIAMNAATGKRLWEYDPKVPPEWAINLCCDVVNRGVAMWKGKVFVGTLDGRLVALDSATGKPVWETLTIDPKYRYSITGAPRVVKGMVIIGNGGAELNVRGYVSAYDAETGKLVWRFYTVPGDPAKPFENPILKMAAKTWTGEWWKVGGGGTVWDSIVYDPDLDQLYIGVGNGDSWNPKFRSPHGGDNLFISSIVALKPETGKFVWYYQETPRDQWDYDSDQSILLTTLKIGGQERKVILHAPKNGIFYVIDRVTGKPISAKPFTAINWATGVDMKAGRPIFTSFARYPASNAKPVTPGPLGAHSWQPMSYSPRTGLVYIPVIEAGFLYRGLKDFEPKKLAFNTGINMVAAEMPQNPAIKQAILNSVHGELLAWDPVNQKPAWKIERPRPWNGGVLSTAGNLVFEGTAAGNFEAYRADNGTKLWSFNAQTGVMAGPVTYMANGEQYVAVLAGWGGVFPLATGAVAIKGGEVRNISRMLVFKMGGTASLPPVPKAEPPVLNPPPMTASKATVSKGQQLYQTYCSTCHGDAVVSGGVLPDLRYSSALANDEWFNVVLRGLLEPHGMVSFSKALSHDDAAAIRAYVIFRAHQTIEQEKASAKK